EIVGTLYACLITEILTHDTPQRVQEFTDGLELQALKFLLLREIVGPFSWFRTDDVFTAPGGTDYGSYFALESSEDSDLNLTHLFKFLMDYKIIRYTSIRTAVLSQTNIRCKMLINNTLSCIVGYCP